MIDRYRVRPLHRLLRAMRIYTRLWLDNPWGLRWFALVVITQGSCCTSAEEFMAGLLALLACRGETRYQ
jgi:hypothetical protein